MSDRVIRVALLTVMIAILPAWGSSQVGVVPEAAAAKRPMKFEDLARMKQVSDPQISSSGKWVVFSAPEIDLNRNVVINHLWAVPLEDKAGTIASEPHERQITFTNDGEFGGRLSPDGKMLLFVANDEQTARLQIFVAPWDEKAGKPGAPKRLTNVITGADRAVWSPDSQRILFTSQVYPECSDEAAWAAEDACDKAKDDVADVIPANAQSLDHLQYLRPDHDTGPKRSHMLVVFAANGDAIRDLTPRQSIGDADVPATSSDDRIGYAWAPDSKEVAFITSPNRASAATTNNGIFTLSLNNAAARPEQVAKSAENDEAPAYSPDGKWLAFRSQARAQYSRAQSRLVLLNRQTGTATPLLPKFERSIKEFTWAADSASIFFSTDDREEDQIYSVAVADEDTIHYVAVPTGHLTLLVPETKSNFSELQISSDGTWLVSSAGNLERPSEIFRISLRIFTDEDPEIKKKMIGLKLAIAADKTAPRIDSAVPVVPEALTQLNNKMLNRVVSKSVKPQPKTSVSVESAELHIQLPPVPMPSAPTWKTITPQSLRSNSHVVSPPIAAAATPNAVATLKTQPELQVASPVIPKAVQPTEPQKPEAVPASIPSAAHNISQGSFAVTINAPTGGLRVGEDARVFITLTNISDHPILFSHRPGTDNPEFSFILLVRNSTGRLMGENIAGSLQPSDLQKIDQIPSGGSVTQTAHLSKLVNLSLPGHYTVRVYRRDADTNQVVQSNEVALTITTSVRAR
ncbi:PD40 domain-containing protein [Tunturiibacter empetritectus]|uniref:Tol biopolymer transport system component n=1 Tax=Tunturiibacter lichenicola TaxID=2051959 RepID=A0A852V8K0_9BACT|nr:PD40 domain-containing protein [Edaphobacter lichenicola]NYF88030.1 Tol biopolymer transport system component [Edaphobacter lichenicola]